MKRFVALARVSSREQEREGFSLDVQEDALRAYAQRQCGTIVKLYRIAETATRHDERTTFKELIAYAKSHAHEIDGLIFYKVDRAVRNLFDYVELEKLESKYDIPFISTSQPTENTPAGRMMRRQLAMFASYATEQQGVDVREGHARRVQSGLFCGAAPYGYRNIRVNGRGLVEVNNEESPKILRISSNKVKSVKGEDAGNLYPSNKREPLKAPRGGICANLICWFLSQRVYLGT